MKQSPDKVNLKEEAKPMLAASSIGLVFIISILIGYGIGVWFDKKLDTAPYGMYFFITMGVASGVKNAYFFIKKAMKYADQFDNNKTETK